MSRDTCILAETRMQFRSRPQLCGKAQPLKIPEDGPGKGTSCPFRVKATAVEIHTEQNRRGQICDSRVFTRLLIG